MRPPFRRRAACQFLELALEVAAVGEAALAGDGLVRPFGMGGQQLFRFLYAQAVQPAGIVDVATAEPCGEQFPCDAHLGGHLLYVQPLAAVVLAGRPAVDGLARQLVLLAVGLMVAVCLCLKAVGQRLADGLLQALLGGGGSDVTPVVPEA